jgi:hypothetical protein
MPAKPVVRPSRERNSKVQPVGGPFPDKALLACRFAFSSYVFPWLDKAI